MSGDNPNYSIAEIGQNTEKSPENLRRLVIIQDSSEKPSANARVKNSKRNNNNNNNNSAKTGKYLDLTSDLKKTLRNMRVKFILIVVGALIETGETGNLWQN